MNAKPLENSEETGRGRELVEKFRAMTRNRKAEKFDERLEAARTSGLIKFANLAQGLRRNEAAVRAALKHV